eukprot:9005367-Heterocapsa_arctica.AAC.2
MIFVTTNQNYSISGWVRPEIEPYVHRAPGCHALRRGDQVPDEAHRYSSVLRPRELLTARRNQNYADEDVDHEG